MTPLSVAAIGVVLALSTRRFEHLNWVNQKLVEKRIAILSDAPPKLNDMYCYFCWVGAWASFSPVDIVQFFAAGALGAYSEFTDTLFRTYLSRRPITPRPNGHGALAGCSIAMCW